MNILIAGAGQVGIELARVLCIHHNVVVVDKKSTTLESLSSSVDILPIHGDVEDPVTYQKLLEKKFNLFIAVTDSDEANLISTIIANESIECKRNIIRLNNHFFAKSSLMQKFDISEAIFPIELSSKSIVNLLRYPKANNVKKFKYTDSALISVRVTNIDGPTVVIPRGYIVAGIERGKDFFIPLKDEPIYQNDLVYLFGDEVAIHHFCKQFVKEDSRELENIVVFGAGDLGISVAKLLIEEEKEVKLIAKGMQSCKRANEKLSGDAIVLNSEFGTSTLYEYEGLEHADVVIATGDDEYNIIKCLEAKERGVAKVISINNDLEYYSLMHSLDIVAIRGPKTSTYNAILESIRSNSIVMEQNYCGGRGRVYMYKFSKDSPQTGKKIKVIKQKENMAIYLVRGDSIEICSENFVCKESDLIVAFCTEEAEETLQKWIYNL